MRPIDADALLKDCFDNIVISIGKDKRSELLGISKVLERIKAAPTLDVIPVAPNEKQEESEC